MTCLKHVMAAFFAAVIPLSLVAEELTFCFDPYPPFTLGEYGTPTGGSKVALLDAVVSQIDGVTARVELMPWQRCQAAVAAGEVDGILPLFPNAERETYMAFSDATFTEGSVFFAQAGSPAADIDWSGSFEDLAHLRLGMLRGSHINKEMEDVFGAAGNLDRTDTIGSLMQMLSHGRIDLVATDGSVGAFYARDLGIAPSITRLARPISARTSHFGLSLKTGADQYLDAFNTAIRHLQETGEMSALQN